MLRSELNFATKKIKHVARGWSHSTPVNKIILEIVINLSVEGRELFVIEIKIEMKLRSKPVIKCLY